MGCLISKQDLYNLEPEMESWQKDFITIGLSNKDIIKFRNLQIKLKLYGNISIEENLPIRVILDYCHEDLCNRPIAYKFFSMYKSGEPNGNIDDLREFIFSLWNICTASDVNIGQCIFSLYRQQFDNINNKDEVLLIKDLFGMSYKNETETERLIAEIQSHLEPMTVTDIIKLCTEDSRITEQLQFIRASIREKTFSKSYWTTLTQRRASLSSDVIFKVFSHINPTVYWDGMARTDLHRKGSVQMIQSVRSGKTPSRKASKDTTDKSSMSMRRRVNSVNSAKVIPISPKLEEIDRPLASPPSRPLSPEGFPKGSGNTPLSPLVSVSGSSLDSSLGRGSMSNRLQAGPVLDSPGKRTSLSGRAKGVYPQKLEASSSPGASISGSGSLKTIKEKNQDNFTDLQAFTADPADAVDTCLETSKNQSKMSTGKEDKESAAIIPI
mmetsp:Transcript_17443/g.17536  ORF Transcript_17443/g.17536 Transcript_17443/m.17536 type:complete len:439 (+) Transcript_17443:383-1699(+)